MVKSIAFISLAETPLSHIRRLSHNRGLSANKIKVTKEKSVRI